MHVRGFRAAALIGSAAGLLVAATSAEAGSEGTKRVVGGWMINRESDTFTDVMNVVAITADQDQNYVLGIRCIDNYFSVVLLHGASNAEPYKERESFDVKFRPDKDAILDLSGIAVSSKMIQLSSTPGLVAAIKKSRRFAFRFGPTEGLQTDANFEPALSAIALGEVTAACPADPAAK